MKALEARQIAERFEPATAQEEAMYAKLIERIRAAAMARLNSITHPWQGLNGPRIGMPTREQQEWMTNRLRADGYTVTHHPDPDPGHYASGPYTTVEW